MRIFETSVPGEPTYAEEFTRPTQLAPGLSGQRVLFHMKTGLKQNASQPGPGWLGLANRSQAYPHPRAAGQSERTATVAQT